MYKILEKYDKLVFLSLILFLYFLCLFILRIDYFYFSDIPAKQHSSKNINFSYVENNGIKVLDLKDGTSYDKGYYHGKKLKGEIKELIEYFKNDLLGTDKYFGRPIYSLLNYKAQKFVEYIPIEYIHEMKGVADGAEVSFNDILLINTYDDLLHLAGCSSMVLPVREGFNEDFYHTRNLDYDLPILAKNKIVLKYKTHISVGFPGYIGSLTGSGEHGISLSSHTSYTNESPGFGIPTGLLYRKIIEEAHNLQEAKDIIQTAKRTIANNIILGSYKENNGLVAEVTKTQVGYRSFLKNKNALIATNYFLSDTLFDKYRTFGKDRYNQYHDRLATLDKINYEKVKQIVSYYDEKIPGWGTIANRGTIQSVIMKPKERKIFIANGSTPPVTNGDFIEITY